MALVWNGRDFVTFGGSDTDESDSEQPLSGLEQAAAILNAAVPPPLPVDAKHARSTADAVLRHVRSVPEASRQIAHDHVLRTPIGAPTIADWVDEQLDDRRTERTIRHAFCFALNPSRSNVWVAKKAKGNVQAASVAKGMALHMRCHPFTRHDAQRGLDMLHHLCNHREQRNVARAAFKRRTSHGPETLDIAVVLVGFQYQARHFGACRYPRLIK
jgi:hypothetical protein